VEKEMLDVLQEHGKMSWDDAQIYLRRLVEQGRLLEDLAD
jgi:sulfite reductase alpha subunit-like flavoprotein